MSRARHTENLPPTPVPPEVRQAVVDYADKNRVSMSEVVRRALSLFLSADVSNSHNSVSYPDKESA